MKRAIVIALLFASDAARAGTCSTTSFLTDPTCTLYGTKAPLRTLPPGANASNYPMAADLNNLAGANYVLRTEVLDLRTAVNALIALTPPVCASDEANRWNGTAWTCIKVVTSPGTPPAAQALAFPGAEGGGALALGGRGGTVYEVTNLNDSGTGSLRACVEDTSNLGARTCVFRVSGVIKPVTNMSVTKPYLTIAGQTAPGAGIAVHTQPGIATLNGGLGQWIFDIQTHDVVIRHLKVWGDYLTGEGTGGNGGMGIVIHAPAYNVIVDHSDIFWTTTEALDVWADTGQTIHNVTVQRSLMGEGLRAPTDGQNTAILVAEAGYNPTLIRNVDMHHNVITESGWRMPLIASDSSRFVNNVIYDWYRYALGFEKGTSSADVIGNHWIPGPSDKSTITEVLLSRYTTNTGGSAHNTFYFSGNKSEWTGPASGAAARSATVAGTEPDGGFSALVSASASYQGGASSVPDVNGTTLGSAWTRATPLCTSDVTTGCTASPGSPGTSITVDPVANIHGALTGDGGAGHSRRLNCDGTWANTRDVQSARILGYVAAKSGGINTGAGYNYLSAGDAQDGVASGSGESGVAVPALGGGSACTDTDHDGMPDAWETVQGLNPNDATDRNGIRSGQPYTNLERYLAGVETVVPSDALAGSSWAGSTSLTDYPKTGAVTTCYGSETGCIVDLDADGSDGHGTTPAARLTYALTLLSTKTRVLLRNYANVPVVLTGRINRCTGDGSTVCAGAAPWSVQKQVFAYGTQRITLDARNMSSSGALKFITGTGATGNMSNEHWKGFEIINSPSTGYDGLIHIETADHIKIEDFILHGNTGARTGVQIYGGSDHVIQDVAWWGNTPGGGDTDGFAVAHNAAGDQGTRVVFARDVAIHPGDDGFDFYWGDHVTVVDCLALGAGRNLDGSTTGGNGNGFKMGSAVNTAGTNTITGSVAIFNRDNGVDYNGTLAGVTTVVHVTAYQNGLAPSAGPQRGGVLANASDNDSVVTDNLSWDNGANDAATGTVARNSWQLENTDPVFTDAANGDLSLLPASPYLTDANGGVPLGASTVALKLLKYHWSKR